MNILVINGPNLNLLGIREPSIYGKDTLEELMLWLKNSPEAAGHSFKFYQSNHEGDIIDSMHDERQWAQGIIINPAAYTHYSYAIRDAISAITIPTVEVHLSDLRSREDFRQRSVISSVCIGQISGLGKQSYIEGIKFLTKHLS
mgnify:CR=1 FL=1